MDPELHYHLHELLKQRNFKEFNKQRPKGKCAFILPPTTGAVSITFEKVDFSEIDFGKQSRVSGRFDGCNFDGATFRGVTLRRVEFGDAEKSCTFRETDFYKASFDGVRMFPADLAEAKNIGYISGDSQLVAAAVALQNQNLIALQLRYMMMQEIRANKDPLLTDMEAERVTWYNMINAALVKLGDD